MYLDLQVLTAATSLCHLSPMYAYLQVPTAATSLCHLSPHVRRSTGTDCSHQSVPSSSPCTQIYRYRLQPPVSAIFPPMYTDLQVPTAATSLCHLSPHVHRSTGTDCSHQSVPSFPPCTQIYRYRLQPPVCAIFPPMYTDLQVPTAATSLCHLSPHVPRSTGTDCSHQSVPSFPPCTQIYRYRLQPPVCAIFPPVYADLQVPTAATSLCHLSPHVHRSTGTDCSHQSVPSFPPCT